MPLPSKISGILCLQEETFLEVFILFHLAKAIAFVETHESSRNYQIIMSIHLYSSQFSGDEESLDRAFF